MCVEIVFLICLKINMNVYIYTVYIDMYTVHYIGLSNYIYEMRIRLKSHKNCPLRRSSSRIRHHLLRSTGAMAPILATLRGASPRITGRVAWHTARLARLQKAIEISDRKVTSVVYRLRK